MGALLLLLFAACVVPSIVDVVVMLPFDFVLLVVAVLYFFCFA